MAVAMPSNLEASRNWNRPVRERWTVLARSDSLKRRSVLVDHENSLVGRRFALEGQVTMPRSSGKHQCQSSAVGEANVGPSQWPL